MSRRNRSPSIRENIEEKIETTPGCLPSVGTDFGIQKSEIVIPKIGDAHPRGEPCEVEAVLSDDLKTFTVTTESTRSEVTLTVPLADRGDGYCSRHVQLQSLTAAESKTLGSLRRALETSRLANGKLVKSNADVVRWLLQQINAAKNTNSGAE